MPTRRHDRTRRIAVIAGGIAIFAAVVTFALAGGSGRDTTAADTTTTGFDLPRIEGSGRVRLADFHGTPTVVNFFASWCTACDAELPGFSKVSRELRGDVAFVGVNSLETGDPLFMPRRHDIEWWPLAADVGGRTGSGLHDALCQCPGMPITAFYDATGELLGVDVGALPEPALRERLRELYGIAV
jgi:thiol-disulfide isomerase/thioredoxin